jgi:hypothetical protein
MTAAKTPYGKPYSLFPIPYSPLAPVALRPSIFVLLFSFFPYSLFPIPYSLPSTTL